MPYKDPEKQREANKLNVQRFRTMKIIIELKKKTNPNEVKEWVKLFDEVQTLADKYSVVESIDMR